MSHSDPKGYYSSLEISIKASDDEIKRAYRRLALLHHPDKNPDRVEEAKAKFQQISHAYAVLSDGEKRQAYDTRGSVEDDYDEDGDDIGQFFEMFSTMFQQHHRGRRSAEERMMDQMFGSMFGGVSFGGPFGSSFNGGFMAPGFEVFFEDFDDDEGMDEEELYDIFASKLVKDGKCRKCGELLVPEDVVSHMIDEHEREVSRLLNPGVSRRRPRKNTKVRAARRR